MARTALAAAFFAALVASASAGEKYDRGLEKAAAMIVADKIGAIRPGLSYDTQPVAVSDVTGAVVARRDVPEGLVRAVDPSRPQPVTN